MKAYRNALLAGAALALVLTGGEIAQSGEPAAGGAEDAAGAGGQPAPGGAPGAESKPGAQGGDDAKPNGEAAERPAEAQPAPGGAPGAESKPGAQGGAEDPESGGEAPEKPAGKFLADDKPSDAEAATIKKTLETWGCSGGEMGKEFGTGVLEAEDVKCKAGQYDFRMDKSGKVIVIITD